MTDRDHFLPCYTSNISWNLSFIPSLKIESNIDPTGVLTYNKPTRIPARWPMKELFGTKIWMRSNSAQQA